jgi:hypothetical protein
LNNEEETVAMLLGICCLYVLWSCDCGDFMKSKMDRYREELAVGADFAGETVF